MFLIVVMVMAAVWFSLFRFRRRRMYELASKIPGQREVPLFGHLLNFAGNTEHIMGAVKNTSYEALKNGSIAKLWLGPNLYFAIADPVDIEFILKTCLEKDDVHEVFREFIGNGVIFAPVHIWRTRRKVIVPTFSPKVVESFVEIFSEQSEILVKQMKKRVGTGFFNLWPYCSAYTLDSVSETVMGTKTKAQTVQNHPYINSLNGILSTISQRCFRVWLHNDFLFRNLPNYKAHAKNLKTVHNFTDSIIDQKRQQIKQEKILETQVDQEYGTEISKRKTFLDLLIESSGKTCSFSDLELREEVLTLTAAGTDTSAVAMSFTLLLLGKYPDIQEKVYQELLDIYGNSDRPLIKEDLTKMVYLDRVVKESLRLYPPVPFIARKVAKEITLPSGWVLPAGSGVPISIWGTHRNKKYWGDDAETFDPDRFSPERFNLAHPCAFMPFSSGSRNCLGYQYAMHSIKTSISRIIRQYRVLVAEESANSKIRVKYEVMMKAAFGYEVALEQRKA